MTAELVVKRFQFTNVSTISELYLNHTFFGYTLEPKDRGLTLDMSLKKILKIKVPKYTAIPYGSYQMGFYYSPSFAMKVPIIIDVPGFSYVEIHIGNYPKDTRACLLVGSSFKTDMVLNSTNTFNSLMSELVKYDKMTLDIIK